MKTNPTTQSINHQGWSNLMNQSHPLLVSHLIEVMEHFPANLRKNRQKALDHPELFVAGSYQSPDNPSAGCLLWHLSDGAIKSKSELSLFFTGKVGATNEEAYIAARDIVRSWDHLWCLCDYGDSVEIPLALVIDVLALVMVDKCGEAPIIDLKDRVLSA